MFRGFSRNKTLPAFIVVLGLAACAQEAEKPATPVVQTPPAKPAIEQEVDAVFETWNKDTTPGASLAVVKDGKIIYSRGYGMASLELHVANTPQTIFHIASISKQFTAFAIQLLAKDGRLSLDDDIRKYLPELHDFGSVITINHLMHHTSGLHDQWNLLAMAGWRMNDVITEDDILNMTWRQKELNFKPGDEYVYCNTGFTLLAEIVHRVSGMPFTTFTQERMFKPLGMNSSHFQDDYSIVVPGRAYSYDRAGDGFRYDALSYSNVGATSLFTTVEDLARWDQNFYDAKIGGPSVIAAMQVQGRLNSGKEIDYATGLQISKYRGLKTVEHSGGDAGYRTELVRFPDQHFSVIILSNLGDVNPVDLGKKVADIYLKNDFTEAAPDGSKLARSHNKVAIDPALLDAYAGTYRFGPGILLIFAKEGDHLTVEGVIGERHAIYPSSPTEFFAEKADENFEFTRPTDGKPAAKAVAHVFGADRPGEKLTYGPLTATKAHPYLGEFYSDELDVRYDFRFKDGKLVLHYPRGDIALTQTAANVFEGEFPIGSVNFLCNRKGHCDALTVGNGRVRNLRFVRDEIKTFAPAHPKKS